MHNMLCLRSLAIPNLIGCRWKHLSLSHFSFNPSYTRLKKGQEQIKETIDSLGRKKFLFQW